MPSEYDEVYSMIGSPAQSAQQQIVANTDATPDKAVRAMELGQVFGTNPSIVYNDLDGFEQRSKAQLGTAIAQQNPHIQDYINSHPMAAKVSNDDYGQLDRASAAVGKVGGESILGATWKGFKDNFDYPSANKEFQAYSQWLSQNPVFGNLFIRHAAEAGGAALELGQRFFAGLVGGAAAGIGQAYKSAGGSEIGGADLTRDLIQMAQVASPELVHGIGVEVAPATAALDRSIGPWVQARETPPVGVHPVIDAVHAAQADLDQANLTEALREVAGSATRERAPDLFQKFMAQHVGDQHIGVSGDAIRALYGEKLPEPGDGILGWVPRIQEQLQASAATGADIQIPLADYLTRVEPETAKALSDFVRMRPEGMTPAEAKELVPAEEPAAQPAEAQTTATEPVVDAVRSAAGIREVAPTPVPEAAEAAQALPMDQRAAFEKAAAVGMTVDQYGRYQRLLAERLRQDTEAATRRITEAERKRQTAEWQEQAKPIREQVVKDLNADPVHQLNEALRARTAKLDVSALSPEDQAGLPKGYYSKSGMHPDDLADLYGFDSGRSLLDALRELTLREESSGLRHEAFRRQLISAEVERRMEAEHGSLAANVLDSVKEQVLSETQQQLLHEETMALAERSGLQFSLTKEQMEGAIGEAFDSALVRQVDSDRFIADAGKYGRAAEMALLKKDPAEAFRQKQQQYRAFVSARLARRFEKTKSTFDRTAKQFSARALPSVDQEYTNWIHQILLRVGKPVKRSLQDLQESLARGPSGASLADFVSYKEGHDLREVPVADFLLDPAFRRGTEDLSVAEYRALADSVKTLAKNGRDEQRIMKAGEEADLADVKAKMIQQLATFKEKHYDASGGRPLGVLPPRVGHRLRTFLVAHLQLETIFRRWDRGDPRGVFSQYISRELATASNYEAALEREVAGKLRALKDGVDLSEKIPNTLFVEPPTAGRSPELRTYISMTRKNLRTVMLNIGNASNLDKLARGYGVDRQAILDWVGHYAKKEDWDFVQGLGDLFASIKAKSDVMYRELSGIEPESIPLTPLATPHGEYRGWYYPIVYHPLWEGASKKLMGGDALEGNNYVRATVPAGYTKKRSGYAGPLSLDMDTIPYLIRSQLHDIAMRPAVIQASKIFYDRSVRDAITQHYGKEYRDLLIPYLKDVANNTNVRSDVQQMGAQWSEFMRQNMISTLIGFNPGTVLKHGPTAWVNSMTEVGSRDFLREVSGLLSKEAETGENNWQFAMRNSEELQRRHRFYIETIGGAHDDIIPQGKFMSLRESLIRLASTPVSLSDLLSATPTWLAKYRAEMEEHGVHGDAVAAADTAVRRAHGSSVITNRPAVMRGGAAMQWLTSLYGFFNHILNRQVEMVWQAGEAIGAAKQGDFAAAAKQVPGLTAMLFSYVIFPALVEEAVTGLPNEKHEGWLELAAKSLTYTASSSWIGIRDLVSGILAGRDPSAGLLSTLLKSGSDVYRDLSKNHPLSAQKLGTVVKHGAVAIGSLTGMVNAQEGRTGKFIYDYAAGNTHPRTLPQWYRGLRYGTTKAR